MHDDVGIVAHASVAGHDVSKDLAVRAIDCFHARLVPVPGEMDFVEAHGFDDAGIVRGIETVDLETSRLRHRLQERLPILLLIHRGFGRDHAEIDLGRRLRAGRHGRSRHHQGGCRPCQSSSHHESSPVECELLSPAGLPSRSVRALSRSSVRYRAGGNAYICATRNAAGSPSRRRERQRHGGVIEPGQEKLARSRHRRCC